MIAAAAEEILRDDPEPVAKIPEAKAEVEPKRPQNDFYVNKSNEKVDQKQLSSNSMILCQF